MHFHDQFMRPEFFQERISDTKCASEKHKLNEQHVKDLQMLVDISMVYTSQQP